MKIVRRSRMNTLFNNKFRNEEQLDMSFITPPKNTGIIDVDISSEEK